MVYLAARPAGELSSLIDVSREQQVSQFSLAKILQQLGHAGLLLSRRGQCGGFALARPASQITVAEVVQASEGAFSLNRCVLHPESCERSETCAMHVVWVRAQESLMSVLEQVTIADLASGEGA
jgi:Rrf2 family protein